MLSSLDKAAISTFAEIPGMAGEVLTLLGGAMPSPFNEQDVAVKLGLSAGQEPSVLQCLRLAENLGLIEVSGSGWRVIFPKNSLTHLGDILAATGYYKSSAHKDKNTVNVVLTRPGQPSRLESELNNLGWKTAALELTEEAFISIAANATERLAIMTPFMDSVGAKWVLSLFQRAAPGIKLQLILRYLGMPSHPSYPIGYDSIAAELKTLGVSVYDYAIDKLDAPGYETFHAKVVLADRTTAYVGSSNMNKASKERSMELGLVVEGRAAQQISRVLESIICVTR